MMLGQMEMDFKMKIWIAVHIDHYGGDMLECWCTFDNFAGEVKVFYDLASAEKYAEEYAKDVYAGSVSIVEKEIIVP